MEFAASELAAAELAAAEVAVAEFAADEFVGAEPAASCGPGGLTTTVTRSAPLLMYLNKYLIEQLGCTTPH